MPRRPPSLGAALFEIADGLVGDVARTAARKAAPRLADALLARFVPRPGAQRLPRAPARLAGLVDADGVTRVRRSGEALERALALYRERGGCAPPRVLAGVGLALGQRGKAELASPVASCGESISLQVPVPADPTVDLAWMDASLRAAGYQRLASAGKRRRSTVEWVWWPEGAPAPTWLAAVPQLPEG